MELTRSKAPVSLDQLPIVWPIDLGVRLSKIRRGGNADRKMVKLERVSRSIARTTLGNVFHGMEKRGGSILDERDGRFIPRRTDVDINNVPERLSNDPETFAHLSGLQFNRRIARGSPIEAFLSRFVNGVLLLPITLLVPCPDGSSNYASAALFGEWFSVEN